MIKHSGSMCSLAMMLACTAPGPDGDSGLDTSAPSPALFAGPFTYASEYDGLHSIDTLWMVSEEAVEEIAALGKTPAGYLNWRIDAMNDTLERSLIDTSIVRTLGVHVITEPDLQRTGIDIGNTNTNISTALSWLGQYREVYGADKVMIVAGTAEGASEAALGGGDVSAHWVTFLPVEHEFGHQMGASHCSEGQAGDIHFGYPASGYDDAGVPIQNGPVNAGTRMCGNSIALFSNPDVTLTLDEIDDMIEADLAPEGNWEALADEAGEVTFGDAKFANMAQQWRNVEASAAARIPTTLYPGDAGAPYEVDDCIALYAEEGYGGFLQEVCIGETITEALDVHSIQVGAGVHTNVYTDSDFGAASMCGGQVQRLAFSTPSLAAMSTHHKVPSMAGRVGTLSVYAPTDRAAHGRMDGPYAFSGAGTQPSCEETDTQELVLMPDNRDWTATAAVYKSPEPLPFAVSFDLRTFHNSEDPPADGLTFFFGKSAESYANITPPREQLGFVPDGLGYGMMFNTWTGNVGFRDGNWDVVGADVSHNSYTDGAWVPVRIEVRAEGVVTYWNGTEIHRADMTLDTTHDTVGFTAGTGYYTMEVRLRDIEFSALE